MTIILNDAEQVFADSAAGKSAVAYARSNFEAAESHKGTSAATWTNDMASKAIRDASSASARAAVQIRAMDADGDRRRAEAEAAYQKHADDLRASHPSRKA